MMKRRAFLACAIASSCCCCCFALSKWWRQKSALAEREAHQVEDKEDDCDGARRTIGVVFGSTTGTAKRFAFALTESLLERVATAAVADDVQVLCVDAANINFSLPSSLSRMVGLKHVEDDRKGIVALFFVLATTGDGEPTAGFKPVQAFLDQQLSSGARIFSGVPFSVFALGDSRYTHFCRAGVMADETLRSLGAVPVAVVARGDAADFNKLERAFAVWAESLISPLEHALCLEAGALKVTALRPPCQKLQLKWGEDIARSETKESSGEGELPFLPPPSLLEPTQEHPIRCYVQSFASLSPDRRVASIAFEIPANVSMTFQPGDHIGIFPPNPREIVDQYLQVLRVPPHLWHRKVSLTSDFRAAARASLINTLPNEVSLVCALRWYCDLCGPLPSTVVRHVASYSLTLPPSEESEKEKEELMALALSAPIAEVRSLFRTTLSLLQHFPKTASAIAIGHFIEFMPRIEPRFYSAACDQPPPTKGKVGRRQQPSVSRSRTVRILVAVQEGGLCSSFLCSPDFLSASGGERGAFMFPRTSSFHMNKPRLQSVMIATGTGIAPFLGFLKKRAELKAKGCTLGDAILLFGCRTQSEVFHLDELQHAIGLGVLTKLEISLSREPGRRKEHVTDGIEKCSELLCRMIVKENAAVFMCGRIAMVKSVESALESHVLCGQAGMSVEEANRFLQHIEKNGRLFRDVF